MDITDALSAVQALLNTAQAEVTGYQGQVDTLTTLLTFLQTLQDNGATDLTSVQNAVQASPTLAANRMTPPDTITEATAA